MVSEASLMQQPTMSTFSHPRQSDYTSICTIDKFLVAARSQTQTKYTMSIRQRDILFGLQRDIKVKLSEPKTEVGDALRVVSIKRTDYF